VAALVLLARAAPAGVVAADALLCGLDHRLRRDVLAAGCRHGSRGGAGAAAGRDHRTRPGRRLVLVAEPAPPPVAARLRRERGAPVRAPRLFVRLDLGMEEERDDLLADRAVELAEEDVSLVAVLDERVLLGNAS